jgi:hypothetical protein
VATQNSIFELNGKAYDALTGAMLGHANRVEDTVHVQSMKVRQTPQAASMDGMITGAQRAPSAIKHVKHRQPQPTQTLMRRAVQTPQPSQAKPQARPIAIHTALQPATKPAMMPAASVGSKLSSTAIDPMRARRAQTSDRSQAVEHFRPQRQNMAMDFRRPAAPAMQQPAAFQLQPQPQLQPVPATQPQPQFQARPQYASARQAAPAAAPQRHDEAAYEHDLFSKALAEATSHEEPAPKENIASKVKRRSKSRKRGLAIVGSLAVFMLLIGFVALQNKSSIQLQLASAKAGFTAAAPLYKPDGYKLDKLSYASGSVSQLYLHNGDGSFTISQKKSNWDSQTLLDNFVATSNEDYQGYQSNGRTIYVYGKGNATWVNGGVWYQIKSSGNIPTDQLVKIASSI